MALRYLKLALVCAWGMMLGCETREAGTVSDSGLNSGSAESEMRAPVEQAGVENDERAAEEGSGGNSAPEMSANAPGNTPPRELPVEQEVDYGEWLRLPESITGRYADIYPKIVASAKNGDANGLANIAFLSQQFAAQLMAGEQVADADLFRLQAAKALRRALEAGLSDIPPSMVGQVFYDEAATLSRQGEIESALTSLSFAVEQGYAKFANLATDEEFANLRASKGFGERLEAWQVQAEAVMREQVREDMAASETFPFSLSGTSIQGETVELDALKGKVLIVDVWGTWCPPCRAEIPFFVQLQEKFGTEGFQMIGINYERQGSDEKNREAVVKFIEEFGINYPCIMGDDATREQIPNLTGFPTTLFIDAEGTVRLKAVGLHEYEYLEAVVQELLSQS